VTVKQKDEELNKNGKTTADDKSKLAIQMGQYITLCWQLLGVTSQVPELLA
jgi:hypothetical protein